MPKSLLQISIIVLGILLVTSTLFYFQNKYQNTFYSDIHEARKLGIKWIENNILNDGLFLYTTNIETGEIPTTNNAIRQLMASRVIALESQSNSELLSIHKKNLEYLMANWYREENGLGYVYFDEKSKLGANAMLLRTLVASPYFENYTNEAKALARGIVHLQKENGSFSAWYIAPPYKYNEEYLLTFYSGEALLALIEYYEKTGNEVYLEHAKRTASFYIKEYVDELEQNYYPAYVPWHTIALNKLHKISTNEAYANAIFSMNDKLLELQDTKVHVGRFYDPRTPQYGNPHASSDAVYTEGLAYAYEIAVLVGDEMRIKKYRDALTIGVENLLKLQISEKINGTPLSADKYVGALRIRDKNPWIRVDTTQHTIDAFDKILDVLF